jgi:hypothetical protein
MPEDLWLITLNGIAAMADSDPIDDIFIEHWQKIFASSLRVQSSYDDLVLQVRSDIEKRGCITEKTFIRLINWKSPRIRPIFEKRGFAEYRLCIKKCLAAEECDKMDILAGAYGIGAPVASTILHFTYPDRFPIIDFRTAEALYHFGLIESPRVSAKGYATFREAILDIRERHDRWSLRQIDMALFAYDKKELSRPKP